MLHHVRKTRNCLFGFHGSDVSDQCFSFWLLWDTGEDHFGAWDHLFRVGQVFVQVGVVEDDSGVLVGVGVVVLFLARLGIVESVKIWTLFVWSTFFDGMALGALLDEELFTFGDEFSRHFE